MKRNQFTSFSLQLRVTSLLVPTFILGTINQVSAPLQAQGVLQPMNSGQKLEDFINNKLIPSIPKNFEAAAASVGEFLEANPDLDRWDKARLVARSGYQLYFANPVDKRAAVAAPALSFLDESVRALQARDAQDPDFLSWEIRQLLDSKVKILLAEKRAADASKVLQQWQTLPPSFLDDANLDDSLTWGRNWRAVQSQQGQPVEAVKGLIKVFEDGLTKRRTFARGITTNIIDELLAQNKTEEALSWAKLAFMLCRFDEGAIRDATRDVTRCLTAGELSLAKANRFAAAQADVSAPNPLDKVPVPQLDAAAIRALLTAQGDKSPFESRLIASLAIGDYRTAMLEARNRLMADVTNEDNARQVAQVFKAKDGDIARANQFLSYYQLGEGENPVPAFLKEIETVTSTTAATP